MPNKLKFKLNDLPPRYQDQIKGQLERGDPPAHADMESVAGNAPVGKKETPRFTSPCRVLVTHFRHRLADYDNLSVKACLDQIVRAGILADDSAIEIEDRNDYPADDLQVMPKKFVCEERL